MFVVSVIAAGDRVYRGSKCNRGAGEGGEGEVSKFLTPRFGTFINLCRWSCMLVWWRSEVHTVRLAQLPTPRDLPPSRTECGEPALYS
jgi:hypothetical protein